MNKSTIPIVLTLVLFACRSDKTDVNRKISNAQAGSAIQSQVVDSAQMKRDSIEQARRLEDAQVVYDKIRFGDSFTKLSKHLHSFEAIGSDEYITRTYFVDPKHENNLFQLDFRSYRNNTANYYDTYIRDSWANLISVISHKYGKPDEEYTYTTFFNMKSGYITWTHVWRIYTKEIRVGVG